MVVGAGVAVGGTAVVVEGIGVYVGGAGVAVGSACSQPATRARTIIMQAIIL
jgi:hypothetical protein